VTFPKLKVSAKNWKVVAAVVFAVGLLVGATWYYLDRRERIAAAVDACVGCLPEHLSMSHEFAYDQASDSMTLKRLHITTVRQKLIELRASCKDGVLYDGEGKKIVFHWMLEWGALPKSHRELEDEEQAKLARLANEGVTVVRMWQTSVPR
jgi:hypothetical protein